MKLSQSVSRLAVSLALAAAWSSAHAQSAKPYVPQEYQAGKDVVWVPTAQTLVDRMLDMAKLTPQDYLVDLGSGDGRTVITAAKRGAKALGVEYNPDMVELSKRNAEKAGVTGKATFVKADIFKTDFSQATVITLFLLPELNLKLRPTILAMKPGTRVVSNLRHGRLGRRPNQRDRARMPPTATRSVDRRLVEARGRRAGRAQPEAAVQAVTGTLKAAT